MADLSKFGLQVDDLRPPTATKYSKPVPGRVAHIDADFMAYQVSAESKAELDPDDPTPRKTYEDMQNNALAALDHVRQLARAKFAYCHVTGKGGNKGGRDAQAMQLPYQANRTDRENRPENLDRIRTYIGQISTDSLRGCIHLDQEADDAMATAGWADPDNTIVCSQDKDLFMVPGWYLDWDKLKPVKQESTFGYVEIKEMVSPTTGKVYKRKLIGRGTKYFWAQLLMGDKADNIQGLPECPGSVWQMYAGTKSYNDLYKQWVAAEYVEAANKISERLLKLQAKTKQCGDMLAFALIDGCKSDKECWDLVRSCYELLAKEHGYQFTNYRTGAPIKPTQALFSEMQLLWMRRSKNNNDVLDWLKEMIDATKRIR